MAAQKHRQVHHLSRDAGDPNGWVESITGLTADQPATDLLNNGAAASKKQNATVSCSIKQSSHTLCVFLPVKLREMLNLTLLRMHRHSPSLQ